MLYSWNTLTNNRELGDFSIPVCLSLIECAQALSKKGYSTKGVCIDTH